MNNVLLHKNVRLRKNLFSAMGGGIAIGVGLGAHSAIKLHPTQNIAAVEFPIPLNAKGRVEGEHGLNWLVVRIDWKNQLNSLYSYQSATLIVNQSVFGSFFEWS